MKFDKISQIVEGVPFIDIKNAKYLYDLIISEKLTNILELGIAHGTATCYMAAALDELGTGKITSVDLLEAKSSFSPSPEEQLAKAGLENFVQIVRMQTGYTWFLHDEIKRQTINDICQPEYNLCIIDGPKNWVIDGFTFFLVDKLLKDNGWIIFDDYEWTYTSVDEKRNVTDGITHRHLSEVERTIPHIKEVFELLVKQHPNYSDLIVYPDSGWAVAKKTTSERKIYTVKYQETTKDILVQVKHGIKSIIAGKN
ncbi:MAG: class I SAM-dependent methyltransferase [Desmonostoc vinosum HA7617-LM4]|nr:class I SAM-dependent methyltransferase [Desmonostoc vinosum HA7617-LM4]